MTREPDRYEAKARELDRWIVRHYGVPEHYTSWPEIAAAIRAAESSALERAAQLFQPGSAPYLAVCRLMATALQQEPALDAMCRCGKDYGEHVVDRCPDGSGTFRALASPAAAPAAEPERQTCVPCQGTGRKQGGGGWGLCPDCNGHGFVTAAPPSEPVAPAPDLRALLRGCRPLVAKAHIEADEGAEEGWFDFLRRIDAALAGGGEGK